MKFGKRIAAEAITEWQTFYIDYKALKKIIKNLPSTPLASSITVQAPAPPHADRARTDDDDREQISPDSRESTTGQAAPCSPNAGPRSRKAQNLYFFYRVERELEKVNKFYLQKEADHRVRLRTLTDKHRIISERSRSTAPLRSLFQAFQQLQEDLVKLQTFVDLNTTGFSKILKKWDKRSKSRTKDVYLSRQIQVQPFFSKEGLSELSDLLSPQISSLAQTIEESGTMSPSGSVMDRIRERNDQFSRYQRHFKSGENREAVEDMESQLISFVEFGQFDSLRSALSDSALPNLREIVSDVFLYACRKGSTAAAEILLSSAHVDFHYLDEVNNRTCVHEATISGKVELLALILEKKPDIYLEASDVYGRQPLHYAAISGRAQVATLLLSRGVHMAVRDHDGFTPLLLAVGAGHTACVQVFLEATGKQPASEDAGVPGGDPLASREGPCVFPSLKSELSLASKHGHVEVAKLLLARNQYAEVNEQGLHPLHLAASGGHTALVELLLQFGAEVDVGDGYNNWTPLFHAASEGQHDCANALLKAGCDVSLKDDNGWTAMTHAFYRGHTRIARLLLSHQSHLPSSHDSWTPRKRSLSPSEGSSVPVASKAKLLHKSSPGGQLSSSSHHHCAQPLKGADLSVIDCNHSDVIPDLSLPPPMMPFRIYGHSYLEKKYQVQVILGHPGRHTTTSSDRKPSVSLFGSKRQLPSTVKLVIRCKPNRESIPFTALLPASEDDMEVFTFHIAQMEHFSLHFDLYPTYGTKLIGRAAAVPSCFVLPGATIVSHSHLTVPLLDPHLRVIGEVSFSFSTIRPFEHPILRVGGRAETYWKSTNMTRAAGAPLNITQAALSRKATQPASTSPSSLSIHASPAIVSCIMASSLVAEYLRILVQVTKDGVPVVYPLWRVPVTETVSVPVYQLDYFQYEYTISRLRGPRLLMYLQGAARRCLGPVPVLSQGSGPTSVPQLESAEAQPSVHATLSPSELLLWVYQNCYSLAETLDRLPSAIGVSVDVRYPSQSEIRAHLLPDPADLNATVDCTLETVYNYVQKSSTSVATHAASGVTAEDASDVVRRNMEDKPELKSGDPVGPSPTHRSIIFASLNPYVCTALNWKQPNYAVFFRTLCGISHEEEADMKDGASQFQFLDRDLSQTIGDRRSGSIKEAIKFAKGNNLLGIFCDAMPLIACPELIQLIKGAGLLLVTSGACNLKPSDIELQEAQGVDAFYVNGVMRYSRNQLRSVLT